MKKSTRMIARCGIVAALVVSAFTIDSMLSQLGMPIKLAIATLMLVLTVCQLFDVWTAIFTGVMFGLTSWLFSILFPNISTPAFINPMVSVFPRVALSVMCYFSYRLFCYFFKSCKGQFLSQVLPRSISGAVGIMTNTFLVMTMIAIFDRGDILQKVFQVVVSINFVIEMIVGIGIVPMVGMGVAKQLKNTKGSLEG